MSSVATVSPVTEEALNPSDRSRDTAVLLIGHGSPDPRHRQAVHRISKSLAEAINARVDVAFLEHDVPSAADVMATDVPEEELFVLPLLLTAGMHWRRDIPPIVAGPGKRIQLFAPPPLEGFADSITALAHQSTKREIIVALAGSRRPEFPERAQALQSVLEPQLSQHHIRMALNPAQLHEQVHPDALVVPLVIGEGVLADRIAAATAAAQAELAPPVGSSPAFAASLANHLAHPDYV